LDRSVRAGLDAPEGRLRRVSPPAPAASRTTLRDVRHPRRRHAQAGRACRCEAPFLRGVPRHEPQPARDISGKAVSRGVADRGGRGRRSPPTRIPCSRCSSRRSAGAPTCARRPPHPGRVSEAPCHPLTRGCLSVSQRLRHPRRLNTGAGGDHGIGHHQNWLRFPYDPAFWRSRYLPPHPYLRAAAATPAGIVSGGATRPGWRNRSVSGHDACCSCWMDSLKSRPARDRP
jgi:hypothetical protein